MTGNEWTVKPSSWLRKAVTEMNCPDCGTKLPDWKYYCDKCGASTDGKQRPFKQKDWKAELAARKASLKFIMFAVAVSAAAWVFAVIFIAIQVRRNHETAVEFFRASLAKEADPADLEEAAPPETISEASDNEAVSETTDNETGSDATLSGEDTASSGETAETVAAENAQTDGLPAFWEFFSRDASIGETVLWDDILKITATGLEYSEEDVRLLLHFDSNYDKNLVIWDGGWMSINGYALDLGNEDVYIDSQDGSIPAGGSADGYISMSMFELEELCITHISRLEMDMVLDVAYYDGEVDAGLNLSANTGTMALDTSTFREDDFAKSYAGRLIESETSWKSSRKIDHASEDVLAEQGGIRVISEAVVTEPDRYSGEIYQTVYLEVENNTDILVGVQTRDLAVNGLTLYHDYGFWDYYLIAPGRRALITYPMDSYLDQVYTDMVGVKEVGKINCCLTAVEYDDSGEEWDGSYVAVLDGIEFVVKEGASDYIPDWPEVYNAEGITIRSVGYYRDQYTPKWYYFVFYAVNDTDRDIYIDMYNGTGTVNGVSVDTFYMLNAHSENLGICIPAGSIRVPRVHFEDEEGQIDEDVKTMETVLTITDEAGYPLDTPALSVSY
ncbi:MAG: hypothetical protein K5770_08435 [Lachnospiraceae bacterium]|nr:hypothetical protein [Lachnospiraceae bacterium]